MGIQKPIRYGKPCLTDLPPELGRMVIDAIIHSEPFDNTQLKKDCKRINRQLARIGAKGNSPNRRRKTLLLKSVTN